MHLSETSSCCVDLTGGSLQSLVKVQRKCLALRLEVPGTVGVESGEVEIGVLPLEIRSEKLSIRQVS